MTLPGLGVPRATISQRELCFLATTEATLVKSRLGSGKANMESQLKEKLAQFEAKLAGAFSKLKELVTTASVLSYPVLDHSVNSFLKLMLVGWGLVLYLCKNKRMVQYTSSIAYAFHTLDSHMRNNGISKPETLALVRAVCYFRAYLLGHYTTVYTDHAAYRSLLDSAQPSGKLARWALMIQEMDLTILHRSGIPFFLL